MENKLKIVTFNVKCGWYGKTLDDVAALLREVDGDIIGIQEVDMATRRIFKNSDIANQTEYIAQKAGYKYWYFAPVLDYQGGFYGHGVISRYPILRSEIIWPRAQIEKGEVRNIERHEIDVGGKVVTFYNCHLNGRYGAQQYAEAQDEYMIHEKYPIFVGDMNTQPYQLEGYLNEGRFLALNGGEGLKTPIKTSGGGNPIDHIIIAKDTIAYEKGETETGLHVVDHRGSSDHNLAYALITLK